VRILITNDDGITAPGLGALKKALESEHEITVVAPSSERSGVGHSITIYTPLMVHEHHRRGKFFGYAVQGTPADCVKLGVKKILKRKVDLIISGINPGANVGVNILYSGTVAAAIEGAIIGVPSMAVSMENAEHPDYEYGAGIVRELVGLLLAKRSSRFRMLNVNIPHARPLKGVKIIRHSLADNVERFAQRTDPRSRTYFWLSANMKGRKDDPPSDVTALRDGYLTLTPLSFDLTDYRQLDKFKKIDFSSLSTTQSGEAGR